MRRSPGTLLLLVALAGLPACGSEDGSSVDGSSVDGSSSGPSGSSGSSPSPSEDAGSDTTGWTQVAILSASNGRGEVGPSATPLSDEAAVTAFTAQLDDGLATEVVEAARGVDVPDGEALYGAVVAIGCEPPDEVSVTRSGDDVVVAARTAKASPSVQCLVPVTSVALVVVEQ